MRFAIVAAVLIIISTTPVVEAAKIILEKEIRFSDDGRFLGYVDPHPDVLEDLEFVVIADYPSFIAGEVEEERLDAFRQNAKDHHMVFEERPNFDQIRVNGYTFSSFGNPETLPSDLSIDTYDGDNSLFLVQFKAPMTPQWHSALTGVADPVSYFPENTYLVRANSTAALELARIDGVQHVSLFQPAYKIRPRLLDREGSMDVTMALDTEQNLTEFTDFVDNLTSARPSVHVDPDLASTRSTVTQAHLRAIARRAEVLWIEPSLSPVLSGEREATVTTGQHDGSSPLNAGDRPVRFNPNGHHGWLRDKGFCTPTEWDPWPECMVYWTKVGVIDSGLDRTVCLKDFYDEQTGECTQWHSGNKRHPDLNHSSNHPDACPSAGVGMAGVENNSHCTDPVIREKIFCSGDIGSNHCRPNSWNNYDFTDNFGFDGHGTAVASIIVGDPLSSGPLDPDPASTIDPDGYYPGTGIAPSAQLIIGRFLDLSSDPSTNNKMTHLQFRHLVSRMNGNGNGARIFNNSWNVAEMIDHNVPGGYGAESATEYTLFSQMADSLVRDANIEGDLSETTLVFSSGNWTQDPVGQSHWATSPGNAKNVISVGAARGWAENGTSAHPTECTYDQQDPHLIRDIAGGITSVVWSSRRGFLTESGSTDDLPRYKPDVVAPGTLVAAARSQYSTNTNVYRCFGGTSAAAPVVTGAAVLAEAWYFHKIGNALPSPAMIKAMLVAHADSLMNGTDHWPPASTLGHSPSMAQGWGRVNLDTLFQEDVSVAVFDQDHEEPSLGRRFTSSGQYWATELQVDDPAKDIIAVLVYTDVPSDPGAAELKVNDLDLTLNGPSSNPRAARTYYGNQFAVNSWYSKNFMIPTFFHPRDEHNNVEVIRVPAGSLAGSFGVRVRASAVQKNSVPGLDGDGPNQDFALYVYNAE